MSTIRDVRSAGLAATAAETGAALIFLHGCGSNEHDPSSLAELLGLELPWAALRAPLKLGHGAAAWFQITTPGVPGAAQVESFPLCGQELERYDEYFEDRLDLQLKIRDQNPVSWRGSTRAALDQLGVWPRGALFAGSPNEIVEKILWEHDVLGHARFLAPVRFGGLPQAQTLKSIELLVTEVMPKARTALA